MRGKRRRETKKGLANVSWRIVEQPLSQFTEQRRLPISFQVISRLDVSVIESGLSGLAMREQVVERPYLKDDDDDDDEEEGPAR